MKTPINSFCRNAFNVFGLFISLAMMSIASNSLQAQTTKMSSAEVAQEGRTIKGMITNEDGPLESVSILLKNTEIGTTTNSKGEFTFPKRLNTGDVLVLSYLGFKNQEVTIRDNVDVIKIQLSEELVEFVGELNTDTPYKSKRSKN